MEKVLIEVGGIVTEKEKVWLNRYKSGKNAEPGLGGFSAIVIFGFDGLKILQNMKKRLFLLKQN